MSKISELSDEIVKIDTPAVNDLAKPKKLMKKTVGLLELGAGALAEKQIMQPIAQKIPIPIPEVVDAVEIVALGAIQSMTDQNDLNNIIGGAIVASSLRLADRLIARLKQLVDKTKSVKLAGPPAISQSYDSFVGGDAF